MENIFNFPIEGEIKFLTPDPLYPEYWFHMDESLTKKMSCPFCEAEELRRKVYDICTDRLKLSLNMNMDSFYNNHVTYSIQHMRKMLQDSNKEMECLPLAKPVYDGEIQCESQSTVEDHSEYPHECPKCKGKAYISLVTCECQNCGKFNLNY